MGSIPGFLLERLSSDRQLTSRWEDLLRRDGESKIVAHCYQVTSAVQKMIFALKIVPDDLAAVLLIDRVLQLRQQRRAVGADGQHAVGVLRVGAVAVYRLQELPQEGPAGHAPPALRRRGVKTMPRPCPRRCLGLLVAVALQPLARRGVRK